MRFRVRFWSAFRRLLSTCRILKTWNVPPQMVHKILFVESSPGLWKLHYKKPELFTRCYFQKQERVLPLWIAYRLVLFLYFLASTIYTIVDPNIPVKDKAKHLIFLTNWSYLLQLVLFGYSFVITARRYGLEKKLPEIRPLEKTPYSYKIYWVLFVIALPISVGVSILFWSLIYDPSMLFCVTKKKIIFSATTFLYPVNAHNLIVHAGNAITMLLDFILIGFPIRIFYIIFPNMIIVVYMIFNIIYYFSGGTGTKGMKPIYKVLDWSDPIKSLSFCVLGFVLVNIVYCFLWIFSLVKEYLRREEISE